MNGKFMNMAIAEARNGINASHGGPFGSIIVKDGEVVGRGHNRVLADLNPTRHGEMVAIEDACSRLGTHDLSGCEIYTTGEPCPMCLCACMWANIDRIYYGCTIADNEKIGFRDAKFDDLMGGRRKLGDYLVEFGRDRCLELFDEYLSTEHRNY
ncbi:MAG: nucleoside deaminase [Bacteroidales bacterium]|nr:nucleoside deaminase [Bacteroidales bacterium]